MKKSVLIYCLTVAIAISGCKKGNDEFQSDIINYNVNLSQAKEITNAVIYDLLPQSKVISDGIKSEKIKTYFNEDKKPYFYIINLGNETQRAFLVISGDIRTKPIVAYSKKHMV